MKNKKGHFYACGAIAIGVICNVFFNISMNFLPGVPLFMDTVFTVAVTLMAGLIPGVLTGLLSNLCFTFFTLPSEYVPGSQIYALCNMTSALVVYLFSRNRKTLPFLDLFLLSVLVCLANSFLGGALSAFLFGGMDKLPSDYIVAGMLIQNFPILVAAIVSRIPINLLDKIIAVFGGYGIYLLTSIKN